MPERSTFLNPLWSRAFLFHVPRDGDRRFRRLDGAQKARVKAVKGDPELVPMLVGGEHIGVKVGVGEPFDAVCLRGEQRRGEPHRVVSAGAEYGERRRQRTASHRRIILNGEYAFVHTPILSPGSLHFKTESTPVNISIPEKCRFPSSQGRVFRAVAGGKITVANPRK